VVVVVVVVAAAAAVVVVVVVVSRANIIGVLFILVMAVVAGTYA